MGISCLISVYARADPAHFAEALGSIYAQTRLPEEIVLIEDGCLTPELDAAIAALDDAPIVIELDAADDAEAIASKRTAAIAAAPPTHHDGPTLVIGCFAENVLLGRALAAGMHLCTEPYVARMDADDIAYPERFEVQAAYLEAHPSVDVLGSAIEEFDGASMTRIKRIPGGAALRAYAKYRCPVNHMTVMMRRDAVLSAGNYRHYPGLEDYELWSRALAAGLVFDNLQQPLVHARVDAAFYDRRGGADYGKRYMELRRQQRRDGLLSAPEYAKARLATAIMVYSPASLRKAIYRFLRRDA